MPDSLESGEVDGGAEEPKVYLPPYNIVLAGLGIDWGSLGADKVSVSTAYLKFLISKIVSYTPVDEKWYLGEYPDVHGAVLANAISSPTEHFVRQGYFEGRLPGSLPFDASWYFDFYPDLGQLFARHDAEGLRRHYFSTGYFEGRVGTPEFLEDSKRWAELQP